MGASHMKLQTPCHDHVHIGSKSAQFWPSKRTMKTLLIAVLCLLALLQVSAEAGNALRRVSMMVPSEARRRAGAKPVGTLPPRGSNVAPPWPPRHTGPKHPQPDIAGRVAGRSHTGLYIINGSNATVGQFPWMLGVFIDLTFFCGGSIISDRWVLTAGHCVDGGKAFEITAGTMMKTGGTEATRQVRAATAASAYRHPDYNSEFVDNDIGVIQVEKPFNWNENVVPVRLPSYSMALDMMVGQRATISGWGKTSDDIFNEGPPNLLFANLQIADGSICFGHYGNTWIPNKICIATKGEGKSTCQGDSGGPLVIKEDDGKWTEIGLTSFGDREGCAKGLPVVFTRVASFLEFIETTTNIEARA